jgi:hypothetical protein
MRIYLPGTGVKTTLVAFLCSGRVTADVRDSESIHPTLPNIWI